MLSDKENDHDDSSSLSSYDDDGGGGSQQQPDGEVAPAETNLAKTYRVNDAPSPSSSGADNNAAAGDDSDSDDHDEEEEEERERDSAYPPPPPPPPPTRSVSARLLEAFSLVSSPSSSSDRGASTPTAESAAVSEAVSETEGGEASEAIEASISKCGGAVKVTTTTERTLSNLTARTAGTTGSGSASADDDDEEDSIEKSGRRSSSRPWLGKLCYCLGNSLHEKTKNKKKFRILVMIVAFVSVLLILVGVVGAAVSKRNGDPSNAATAASGDGGASQVGGGSGSDSGTAREQPTAAPTISPTSEPAPYIPGDLTVSKEGVLLSTGLDVRIIATSLERIRLADGTLTADKFHNRPDAGATFAIPRDYVELYDKYPGGYVYTSNAESSWDGGVGSIFFDGDHNVVDYKRVLSGATEWNCGGGKTPWETWISCEEPMSYNRTGFIYEVDPFGRDTTPRRTVLGEGGGAYESFAYDVRDRSNPRFFYTEDHRLGPVRRFTPSNPNWDDPSNMLHGEGDIEYLVLEETMWGSMSGTFTWTKNREIGEATAAYHFPYTEGIDCTDGLLVFANKGRKALFQLDLDGGTWSMSFTSGGAFDGGPDTVARMLNDPNDILYMTEDGGVDAGVHGRDSDGNFYVVLESPLYYEETTGLAFSPDGRHMFVAYQKNGILLDVWREDGLPFSGRTVDIKYHSTVNGDII